MRIAADQWRLGRAFPMEAGIFRKCLMKAAEEDPHDQKVGATDKKNAA